MATLALPLIMSGISALGGILGNRSQQQTSTSKYDNTQTGSTTPVYDTNVRNLRDILVARYLQQLGDFDNSLTGETITGLNNINQGAESAIQQLGNILASRGIRGPAAGFALGMPKIQQQMSSANFLNALPQQREQRLSSILGGAGGFLNSLPTGSNTTQTSSGTQSGTQTNPGNMLGGGVNSLASMLAYTWGRGGFGKIGG